ncbi:MAG: LPS export ABC transporter permease LptG [Paraglaciecola sp.]|uniref:LPS export ABC transporter permease LptG n=1 Tax=Pseudomonadati TaxID=3379134 RepID=UPI00273D1708|nr:LPS export ABC transporter permease LptG [Paraglaciecola sp.]MDP5032023.1 LPS export ABC transporter permease LptG [Paraglaciecola sp.]MDP5131935.1 LPS export ABC transporter permease LptG [Paraglaciecola sp.]
MFKIIDLYIARTLLATTLMSLCVLTGLSALIRFIEQMKQVGKGSYDMTVAAIYILLSLPREFEQFFPMATLIGGLIGMGMLASNSELVVMQASGQSRWNIIVSAMKSALLMVVVVMMIGEWVAPLTEAKAKEIRTQAISGGSLFSSDRLVWAKDAENFVSIGEVIDKNTLRDVTVYRFNDSLALQQIMSGEQATYDGQAWLLKNVEFTDYLANQINVTQKSEEQWVSTLTPDKLGVVTVKPEALSIQGLYGYVDYLENNSQDPNRYKLAFWRKVLQPLTVGVMLLMALSFIFGPLRSVTMGARIIMGVLTGFGFFVSNEVFGTLSTVYQLPPLFGAVFPSAVFAIVAIFLLRRRG